MYEVETAQNDTEYDTEEGEYFLGSITSINSINANDWTAEAMVGRLMIKFKINIGADVTVIPSESYHPSMGKIQPSDRPLYGSGKSLLPVSGTLTAMIHINKSSVSQVLYLIECLEKSLLGKPAIKELGLLKRVNEVTQKEIKTCYPSCFQWLSSLKGEYTICLKSDVVLFALTIPRRIAQPLLPLLYEKSY